MKSEAGGAQRGEKSESNADGRGDADVDGDSILDCNDYCPVYASPGAAGDGRFSSPLGTLQEAIDLAGAPGCYEVRISV